ncbi:hypothetical protein GGH96_003686 [Coemansia sp. RSA 1972]|nr:hypothetical protein GGH96_003686 [Coemansia sp. RSA 1972]
MGKIDVETLTEVCGEIVRNGDLDTLTDRVVRRSAEEKMGLESKALDKAPYKQLVKDTVAEVLAELTKAQESGNSGAAESEEEADKGESDGSEEEENDKNDSEEEDNGKGDSDNEDDDFSDVMDKEPAPSRPKKRESASTSPQPTKRAKTAKPSSGSDTTITNLKSYIAKCGLRKVWAKELANMNGAQQIRHLKAMLDGLGMTGRPTLEKCKKIKAKRDLQAELEEMHVDNIISKEPEAGVARSRRGARVVAYNVDHVSDSEEEEEEEEEAGGAEEEQSEESEQEESDVYTEAESDSGDDDGTKMDADGSDDDAGSA